MFAFISTWIIWCWILVRSDRDIVLLLLHCCLLSYTIQVQTELATFHQTFYCVISHCKYAWKYWILNENRNTNEWDKLITLVYHFQSQWWVFLVSPLWELNWLAKVGWWVFKNLLLLSNLAFDKAINFNTVFPIQLTKSLEHCFRYVPSSISQTMPQIAVVHTSTYALLDVCLSMIIKQRLSYLVLLSYVIQNFLLVWFWIVS